MSGMEQDRSRGRRREPASQAARSPQEAAIVFLKAVEHAIEAKIDPLLRLEGTFPSGGVDVPRVTLSRHDGAGLLAINVSASELGRIAGASHSFSATDEQLGVGLLIQMREFLASRVAGHVNSHTETNAISAAVATYQGKELRPAFRSVTEASFLRIVVPIDEVEKSPEQVQKAIDSINFIIGKIFTLGGNDAIATAVHHFGIVPEEYLDAPQLPEVIPTKDEPMGDAFRPPKHEVSGEFPANEFWKTLENHVGLASRSSILYKAFGSRQAPLVDNGTHMDLRILLSPDELDHFRQIGVSDPAEFLRQDLELMTAAIKVRGSEHLAERVAISSRSEGEAFDYFHFQLNFKASPMDEDGRSLRFERSQVLGHLVDLLSSPSVRGLFR
jgi:hypothetical protein